MSFTINQRIVSLVFPASCAGCGEELSQSALQSPSPSNQSSTLAPTQPAQAVAPLSTAGFMQWQHSHWCETCWAQLTNQPRQRCQKCDARLLQPSPFDDSCALCHGVDLRFDRAFAIGNYQGLIQEMIISMKGRHEEATAIQLGALLGFELLGRGETDFDRIVPVPTHWWRKLNRGFHAAAMIGASVSRMLAVPVARDAVRLVRSTQKQGTLSNQGRIKNVRGAFSVPEKTKISGQRLLLVDDVMTSGATTSELARVLKQRGAAEVCVAVVARGARVS